MSRRKGERPLPVFLDSYTPAHPVAHAIATGSSWFGAWLGQKCTPLVKLARATGIDMRRLMAIDGGDKISRAELDALGIGWSVSTGDLIASIGDPAMVID